MRALILSGGGALGAFQVGAEKYAREVKNYSWDLIAGISVGALNGALMAMGRYQRLYEIWSLEMKDRLVYGPLGRRVPTGLLGLRSLYSRRALRRLVERELGQGTFQVPLLVGAVSLITGKYEPFDSRVEQHSTMLDAVLASAAMPVVAPPEHVGSHPWMIDGGVRNTSPVGDVLKENPPPDEIVIINCLPRDPAPLARPPRTFVGIGIRSYDVMVNEIFREDVKEFLLVNGLAREAQLGGVVLHHPGDGRPLREVPNKIIQPDAPLGDGLNFSREQALSLLAAGKQKAQAVLP